MLYIERRHFMISSSSMIDNYECDCLKYVQRAWQRYKVKKSVALELQQQWESMINSHLAPLKKSYISSQVLRPFIFFTTFLLARYRRIQAREKDCIRSCFRVILESINSTGMLFLYFF